MGDPLLEAYVELKADASNLDAVLATLPPKVAKSVEKAASGMKPLQDAIKQQEDALKAYIATLTGLTPKQVKANDTVKDMSTKLEGLKGQLASVRGSIDRQLLGGLDATGKGANSAGYKLLQFGQILDDLQYVPQQGLRPILNNIIQFAPAIGIALIAVEALVKGFGGWGKLIDFGHTKTEAERMEELAKATEHVADAQQKLNKMKLDEAAVEAQRSSRTAAQKQQAQTVGEAIAEGPVDEIVRALVQNPDLLASTDDGARVMKDARERTRRNLKREMISGGMGQSVIVNRTDAEINADPRMKKAQQDYEDELDKAARRLMAQAQNDPGKLRALINRIEANPGAFPGGLGLAAKLKTATPEAIQRAKDAATTAKADKAQDEEDDMISRANTKDYDDDLKRLQSLAESKIPGFTKRYGVESLSGRGPNREGIIRDLEKQGVSGTDADAIAGKVAEGIEVALEKRIKEYATESGLSLEASRAKVLLDEKIARAQDAKNTPQAKLAELMRPQMHSIQSYFDKLTMAHGQDPMVKLATEQARTLVEIRDAVKKKTVSRYGNRQS